MLDPPPLSELNVQPLLFFSSVPIDYHKSNRPFATINDIKSIMHNFVKKARAEKRAALMMEIRQQKMMNQYRNDMDAIVKQLKNMQI